MSWNIVQLIQQACSAPFLHTTEGLIQEYSVQMCVWNCFLRNKHWHTHTPSFFLLQGFWRWAVWSHRWKGFLHREGCEHINPTSPRCCELPAQDGHRTQRSEGRQHTQTHIHTTQHNTRIGSLLILFTAAILPRFDTWIMFLDQSWAGCVCLEGEDC